MLEKPKQCGRFDPLCPPGALHWTNTPFFANKSHIYTEFLHILDSPNIKSYQEKIVLFEN